MSKPLSDVKAGRVVLVSMAGGEGMHAHMAGMQIVSGMTFDVLRNDGRGPMVIRVHNTRIALGRKMAARMLVKESDIGVT